jgi:membrane-bound lytic murein transglycosylase D
MKKGRTVNRAWTHVLAGAILFFSLGGAAYASKNWVQDRRVTSAQAQKMADDAMAKSKSKHPLHITVTSRVVKQLNRFIGTPEGREYMRNALQRMENYRAMMEPILDNPDAPRELMAIPIIESGYENLPERSGSVKSAGLWQFIPRTAEVFGLRVNGQVDERLDEKKATKAAIRYLKSNYWRFDSWKLSIIAYNAGEAAVQKAIDATGSREPWTLIDAGVENDTDYFAKVMAAMIIMGNPESVQE